MKHLLNKAIAFTLVLLILISSLASCVNDTGDNETNQITTDEIPVTSGSISLVSDGVAKCKIVRSSTATATVKDLVNNLSNLFASATGATPKISTDKQSANNNGDTVEILVGVTSREESATALEGIGYGDYIVKFVNNKLVINALSSDALADAITAFGMELLSNGTEGSFAVSADINLTGTGVQSVNALPTYDGGKKDCVYDNGNDNYMLVVSDTTAESYTSYLSKLESSGFEFYTDNQIKENKFATYINDKYIVNASYTAYENTVKVNIEPLSTLPTLEPTEECQKLVEPSISILGLAYPPKETRDSGGLSLVIQSSEGGFTIIDGGYKNANTAKAIYDYMKKYAPDPDNIVIDAWVITHAHSDHWGSFYVFADTYADKVTLKHFIANFPSDTARYDGNLQAGDVDSGNVLLAQAKKFDGVRIIKAHAGQKYFFGDLMFEVLFTTENYAPQILTIGNTTSTCLNIELGGQKFLMLADATDYVCEVLANTYGDYLKSDIVQVAHHGFSVGRDTNVNVIRVYEYASADVVLWPCATTAYEVIKDAPYNKCVVNLAKEVFIAGAGGRVVRLVVPYTVGTSGCDSLQDWLSEKQST
ncbi:MAG: MBL fold metallo-hydrolase [Clostridia bacterium]|nr:MBL fold metallo-hydrolase [Clostridia bacterium]